MKRCTQARLNQRRTAHQFTQLVHSSQYVSQHSAFVLHRSNSVHSNNRKRTVNVLEVRSSTQNTRAQQCNRAKTMQVFFTSNDAIPQFLLQPVSCSFPSTARRSHRMVPTTNLQLASSLLGRVTILGSETSCCGGPYWTALPPGSCCCRGADALRFSSRVRPAVGPSLGSVQHRAAVTCRLLLGVAGHTSRLASSQGTCVSILTSIG